MTAPEILRGVADLFATPGTWTQDAWARDAKGERLPRALDDQAVCWCLLGAIRKVRGPAMSPAEDRAIAALRRAIWPCGREDQTLAGWNDDTDRDVEDVRRVALKAAEMLEARP